MSEAEQEAEQETTNPLLQAVDRFTAVDPEGVFDPQVMIGVSSDELMEYVGQICGSVVQDRTRVAGAALLTEDDLAYLLIMGVLTGIDLERERK